jgi:tRNA nucleotidyltransferase/poly(A) polymerase
MKIIKAYLVGGAVRDGLLGIKSKDLDYAVEAPSYEAMVEWIRERGKIFLESPQFWTVRAHLEGGQPADYVLCRKDGQYSDGRRPDSVEPGTLLDDLSRRDFTVNAMALDETTNELIDPFDGQKDLKKIFLRCVGNTQDRFKEDALRMLRALRFSITRGFCLSYEIIKALENKGLCDLLSNNVSSDRKRDEMYRCFAYDTVTTMDTLATYPLLTQAIFDGHTGKIWLMPTSKDP